MPLENDQGSDSWKEIQKLKYENADLKRKVDRLELEIKNLNSKLSGYVEHMPP